jgi:hypothetical protein
LQTYPAASPGRDKFRDLLGQVGDELALFEDADLLAPLPTNLQRRLKQREMTNP